jgi:hypothetical protein
MRGKMPANMQRPGRFQNVVRGWFEINGKRIFLRSRWEANYALYLDWRKNRGEIRQWEYEPETFVFHKIKRGTCSYRPDFKVTMPDESVEYHEVKGWVTKRSNTQFKRMAKYYPGVKLLIVDRKFYESLEKQLGKTLGFFDGKQKALEV